MSNKYNCKIVGALLRVLILQFTILTPTLVNVSSVQAFVVWDTSLQKLIGTNRCLVDKRRFGSPQRRDILRRPVPFLCMSGDGIAKGYTWHEEAFELEVTVNVPKKTKAKDIKFKATPTSIDLQLIQNDSNCDVVLLDPTRPLRGRVALEGTFWVISDPEETDSTKNNGDDYRQVTVTIEKQIRTPKDDFDVIDYDWKGVYQQEEEDEVSYRRYDEAEELDVREYAASLGVDIDNINMSMVDKSMFSSGLNLTQSSLESLKESGLMQEVTQQADGEWYTNRDGERVPSTFVTSDRQSNGASNSPKEIPFLDTDSPWHSVPAKGVDVEGTTSNITQVGTKESSERLQQQKQQMLEIQKKNKLMDQQKQLEIQLARKASDPIDTLTVARLKEILRSRGLKVGGNKKELQARLRAEVQSLLIVPKEDTCDCNSADEKTDIQEDE